jgi:hypothetical protein
VYTGRNPSVRTGMALMIHPHHKTELLSCEYTLLKIPPQNFSPESINTVRNPLTGIYDPSSPQNWTASPVSIHC